MRPTLKTQLQRRELLVGTFAKIPSLHTFEALAESDLDVVCIDGEHAPFDRQSVDMAITVLAHREKPSIVRVPELSTTWTLSALDSGANAIMAPHICNIDDAQRLVRMTSYCAGGRGFAGSTRAADFGKKSIQAHLQASQDTVCRLAMIEDREALANLDELFSVKAIDAFFVGRVDLTVALGETDIHADAVQKAIDLILLKATEHQVCIGMFSPSPDDAKRLIQRGVSLLLMGSDSAFLTRGASALAAAVRA